MSITIATARSLMAALAPLTGTRSSGKLVVNASPAGTATLPAEAYGLPVIDGSIRYERAVKTTAATECSSATAVDVVSALGGAEMNLAAGTKIRWFPAQDGIETESVVDSDGMTGGAAPTGFGSIRQLAFFEELGVKDVGSLLARGVISKFPAAVLAWESSGETTPMDRRVFIQPQTFGLYLIDSREDSQASRRIEGLALKDACQDALVGRTTADGRAFCTPAGVHVRSAKPLVYDPKWFVYRLELGLEVTLTRSDYRTYHAWAKVRLDATTPEAVSPLPLVTDNELDMPQ